MVNSSAVRQAAQDVFRGIQFFSVKGFKCSDKNGFPTMMIHTDTPLIFIFFHGFKLPANIFCLSAGRSRLPPGYSRRRDFYPGCICLYG